MGKKTWWRWAGLALLVMATNAPAETPLTGEDLFYLLSAQFATQAKDAKIAIPAWKQSVKRLPSAGVLAAATKAATQFGDLPLALQWARRWHEIAPSDSASARFEAGLLLASGQDREAIELLQATLARFPNNEQVSSELAELLAHQGRLGDAERLLESVVQQHPDAASAYLALGRVALLQKQPERAESAFAKALQLRPNWDEAAVLRAESLLRQGQDLKALQELQGFCAAHPSAVDARLYLAQLYLRLGGQTQAYRTLQQVSVLRPDQAEIWNQLLPLAIAEKDWKGSQNALMHLRDLQPHAAIIHLYAGEIAAGQKNWASAIASFRKLGDTPLADQGQLQIAQAYYAQGQRQHALETLQALQRRHPHDTQIALLQAQLLREEKSYPAAAKLLDQALAQHPRNADLWYARGSVAEAMGDFAGMEKAMRIVIALQPSDAQAYNFLGYSLLQRKQDLGQAAAYLEKAMHYAPDDPSIQDSIGWLYHLQGKQREALAYLEKAHAGLGDDPEVLEHLGRVLWSLGRQKEARALWQRGLRLHPNSKRLQEALMHP